MTITKCRIVRSILFRNIVYNWILQHLHHRALSECRGSCSRTSGRPPGDGASQSHRRAGKQRVRTTTTTAAATICICKVTFVAGHHNSAGRDRHHRCGRPQPAQHEQQQQQRPKPPVLQAIAPAQRRQSHRWRPQCRTVRLCLTGRPATTITITRTTTLPRPPCSSRSTVLWSADGQGRLRNPNVSGYPPSRAFSSSPTFVSWPLS